MYAFAQGNIMIIVNPKFNALASYDSSFVI